jgi:hypothetical protein
MAFTFGMLVLGLAIPTHAGMQDTYYCEMRQHLIIEDHVVDEMVLDRFQIRRSGDVMTINGGQWFSGSQMPITFSSGEWFDAAIDNERFSFKDGHFYYSFVTFVNVRAISGVCSLI